MLRVVMNLFFKEFVKTRLGMALLLAGNMLFKNRSASISNAFAAFSVVDFA